MKKIIVLLVLVIFSCELYSQLTIYGRYTVDGKIEPNITIFGTKKISEKFKLTYLALVEERWSEALISIAYAPTEFIEISIGGGVEHNPAIYRLTASIWLGLSDNTSLLLIGEKGDGKNNYWYKGVLEHKVSKNFSTGIMGWRFHGFGPFAKFGLKKLDSKLWILPAYDFEIDKARLVVGIDINI